MSHQILDLNFIAILVVTLIGFALGSLWYSPVLFLKPWFREMKITPEMMKANSKRMVPSMIGGFLCTLVSTTALALLIYARHVDTWVHGAAYGLVLGVGIVGAREATNAIFEGRTVRHFLITTGHDVVLLAVQGAILEVWR